MSNFFSDSNGTAEAAPTDTTIGSETNNSSSSVTNKCLRVLACAYAREYSGLEDVNHSLRAIVLDPIALLLVLEENLSAAARTGVAAMSEAQLCAVGGALATLVLHEAFGSDVEELVRDAPQGGGDEWLPRTLIPHWSELLVRVALTRISRKPVAEVCEHMERVLHFHEMVAPVRFSVHLPGQGGDDDFDTLLSLANSIRRFGELTTKRTSMVKHLLLFMKAFCRTSRREHTAIWDRMSEFVQNAHDRACLGEMSDHKREREREGGREIMGIGWEGFILFQTHTKKTPSQFSCGSTPTLLPCDTSSQARAAPSAWS